MSVDVIKVQGAREHNLKDVSLEIPKKTLTVITGVSGSGKSSLAFDTIYAEGQRRYVESLSAYARQFLNLTQKPDVDRIEGLSPAIAIEQKTTSKNPRSTVGTITEIYDYLRLLWANVGKPHCPNHPDTLIEKQTVDQMVDHILAWPEGTRLQILAPVVRGRKGEYKKELLSWQKTGFTRVRINGDIHDIADAPALDKKLKHDIEVVVDRLVAKPENKSRLAESLETALKLAEDLALVEPVAKGEETDLPPAQLFSAKHACPICSHSYTPEPRLFSFNSPFGACPTCDGLGEDIYFDPNLVVPDDNKTIAGGAVLPWKDVGIEYYGKALAMHYKFDINTPWKKLPEDVQDMILYGSGKEEIPFVFSGGKANFATTKNYEGVIPNLERRWREGGMTRDDINRYRNARPCPTCHGARLNPDALSVRINDTSIHQFTQFSVKEVLAWTEQLDGHLSGNRAEIATPILREIKTRLGFLQYVGLEYLSLDRMAGTLSGGESQRIRLASQVGSGLTGVLYVLDEPSIGLHPRDNNRLLDSLRQLRDLDNTVLVVEHDEDAIRTADHVVDVGPLAGEHGGQIIAQGTTDEIMANADSLTGQYLTGKRTITVPDERRSWKRKISISGARANNLQNVSVDIPLGVMTCVTGVSGSGKSTLIMDTLYPAAARHLNGTVGPAGAHDKIAGLDQLDKVVHIDQSPIGRTPRSNPATYTGLYGPIRDWFAGLPEAQARGYKPGRFSFNVKGGRCENCQGDGYIKVEMHFLPDVYVPCEVCNGKRFNRETLEVTYKDHSIADILHLRVDQALEFFEAMPQIKNKLQTLHDVGLGYIRLGQAANTLSGGEAQRVKLAKELTKRATGKTLYILDEPTTGLHFADVDQLLKVLHRLVDTGNTMVIIEHNLDVIKTADWLIDIGPEGGSGGGTVVATGTPEDVANTKASHTGEFLKPYVKTKGKAT